MVSAPSPLGPDAALGTQSISAGQVLPLVSRETTQAARSSAQVPVLATETLHLPRGMTRGLDSEGGTDLVAVHPIRQLRAPLQVSGPRVPGCTAERLDAAVALTALLSSRGDGAPQRPESGTVPFRPFAALTNRDDRT